MKQLSGRFRSAIIVFHCGPAAGALAFPCLALALKPALARSSARLGRTASPRHDQARPNLLRQSFQGELAITRLPPRLLGDGGHERAAAGDQSRALSFIKHGRSTSVEDGLYPRSGDVGVLPTGAGRATGAQLDLPEGNRKPLVDPQPFSHSGHRSGRRCQAKASIFVASSKSAAVTPPLEWVESETVTVSQEISKSGWWFIASAGSTKL